MKRLIIFHWVVGFAITALLLGACSEIKGEHQEHNKINRPTNNVVEEYKINERYILIETQLDGNAPRFDIYDQEDNEIFNLPTMPEYVDLEDVVNENYIVFRSTGSNSETVNKSVSKLIKCFRTEQSDPAYVSIEEPILFNFTERVIIGSEDSAYATDIIIGIGLRDVQVAFESKEENPLIAGGPSTVPQTLIYFKREANMLVIRIKTGANIDSNILGADTLNYNLYIEDCSIYEDEGAIEICIYINDDVSGYYVDLTLGESPYIKISFR